MQTKPTEFGLYFATTDETEGMTAFVEKRKPNLLANKLEFF